jgi:hypothetical protein
MVTLTLTMPDQRQVVAPDGAAFKPYVARVGQAGYPCWLVAPVCFLRHLPVDDDGAPGPASSMAVTRCRPLM